MEPFKHKLTIAATIAIAGAYTTRNAPGMDILSLEPGAEITISPELIQQFAAVNQVGSAEQTKPTTGQTTAGETKPVAPVVDNSANRPQGPLAGAVSPGVASGTSTSPQAGTPIAGGEGGHFSLGEVNPANGAIVDLPIPFMSKAGEVLVNMKEGDTGYLRFVVPEYAAENPGTPGTIKAFAVPGLDNYRGHMVIGNSPMPLDGTELMLAPEFRFLVNETATEEEKPGYSRLNVGDTIVISVQSLSGSFGIQIQWPV